MSSSIHFLAPLLLAVSLAISGCDAQHVAELEEGVATEADVRARFGEPEKVWDAADMAKTPAPGEAGVKGARTFEYSRQPEGRANYMITIGPDGRMSALRQVLNPQNFGRIAPGMAMEQVRKMLGKPARITPYALKQQTEYDWKYLEGASRRRIFTVVFDADLRVVSSAAVDEDTARPSGGANN